MDPGGRGDREADEKHHHAYAGADVINAYILLRLLIKSTTKMLDSAHPEGARPE